jgi:hypothetical protein
METRSRDGYCKRKGRSCTGSFKTPNGILERAVQHLYPLELTCDESQFRKPYPTAPTFQPRVVRDAAVAAILRVQDFAENELA